MLQARPTKNGTGVSIYGDYGDLNLLYDTIHNIANTLDENNELQKGHFQLLMNFAYEIRKAYSGQRLIDKIEFIGDNKKVEYYGFQVVWTDILIFISTLRFNAGYSPTDKSQQANMYLLEYIVEKALFAYDTEGANVIKEFIAQRINIINKYAFLLYQVIHIKYVTDQPGKKRFRKMPHLLGNYFSEWSIEYKEFISSLKISAQEQNCEIIDLELTDTNEIKW